MSTKPQKVPYTLLDRAIAVFSPRAALSRLSARAAIEVKRGYLGASRERGTQGWISSGTSADAEIAAAGGLLRARSRDLVRNDGLAANGVQVLVNNIAGDGIRPRAKTGSPDLDKKIDEAFEAWSKRCDRHGILDFYGMQALAVREMIEGGDCFAVQRPMRRRPGEVSMQVELREADHLDTSRMDSLRDGGRIDQGIEYSRDGSRAAYWMFDDHPGGTSAVFARRFESRRIPAGRVAHLFERQRVQSRGVPWGVSAMRHMKDLDDWHAAELKRKQLEACVVGVVLGGDADQPGITPSIKDTDGALVESFEPGMFSYALGAKDVKFNQPAATAGVAEWVKVQQHRIACGWRMPYALMSGDLSQNNFSSSRVGLNEFRRMVTSIQWLCVIPQFCQPIYDWFLDFARLEGIVPAGAVVRVEWAPPRFETVNPKQDVEADIAEVRAGFATLESKIAARGYSPDDVFKEHKATNKKLDDAELVFDSDARRVSKGGQYQISADGSADGQDDPPPGDKAKE